MSNQFSSELLRELLPVCVNPVVFDSLPSTSTYLREQAKLGVPVHTLVVASSQTDGRGRFGRKFFSPPDTGVYFSILLRPAPENDAATLITVAAAQACAEACEAVFHIPTEIKWVNDVLVNGQKAVGILAEAFTDGDFFVILGIGANIAPPEGGFPSELPDAGAFISPAVASAGMRERYVAETITRLLNYIDDADRAALISSYRTRVKMTGKTVMVTKGSEQFIATVVGVDDEAHLIVSRPDGSTHHISYGEVTLHNENI